MSTQPNPFSPPKSNCHPPAEEAFPTNSEIIISLLPASLAAVLFIAVFNYIEHQIMYKAMPFTITVADFLKTYISIFLLSLIPIAILKSKIKTKHNGTSFFLAGAIVGELYFAIYLVLIFYTDDIALLSSSIDILLQMIKFPITGLTIGYFFRLGLTFMRRK